MNINKLLEKALAYGNQQFDIKEFATLASYVEAYGGGYVYSGETYYLPARQNEFGGFWRPVLAGRLHFVKQYDCREPESFVAQNMTLLVAVQQGEVVEYFSSLSNGSWNVHYMRINDSFISVHEEFSPRDNCENEHFWSAADDVKAEEDARYKREQALSREAQRAKAFSLGERAFFKG